MTTTDTSYGSRAGSFGRYKEAIERLERDVWSEWEQYALEALNACRKMTEKLEGKPIGFRHLNRVLHGTVAQICDQCGMITILVNLSTGQTEIDLRDVVYIGRRPKA